MVATTKLFYLQVYKNIKGVLEPIYIGKSASTAKSGGGDFCWQHLDIVTANEFSVSVIRIASNIYVPFIHY